MISPLLDLTSLATGAVGDAQPYGTIALSIACFAFLLVIIEVTVIRRPAALDHSLRIPLDDGQKVESAHSKGGSSDESR